MDRLVEAAISAGGDQKRARDSSSSPVLARVEWEQHPAKRGSNLACLKCRAIKVKCSRSSIRDDRCSRCIRLDLECEFKQHARGRRPNPPHPKPVRPEARPRPQQQQQQQQQQQRGAEGDATDARPSGEQEPSGRWYGPYLQTSLASSRAAPSVHARRPSERDSDQGQPFDGSSVRVHDRNMAPSWAPQPQIGDTSLMDSPKLATSLYNDALSRHVISMAQAQELFDCFFTHLNPPIAALDSSLHTLRYCQRHRPILLSTILSVSARFYKPELYDECFRIAREVLNLAAVQEICSLDHIQALILVMTWKDPADRTTVRKAVRAIGYAYEIGLHTSFEVTAQTGDDATSRRLDRDRQRTWIVLCLIQMLVLKDERGSNSRSRLVALDDHPDPYVWLQTGGDVVQAVDSRLAWSLDACLLMVELDPMLDLISRSDDPTPFGVFFQRYRSRMDAVRLRYFNVSESGDYTPRFAMDASAVAELPYLDAHRDFFMCEAVWHWTAQLVTANQRNNNNSSNGNGNGSGSTSTRTGRTYAGASTDYLVMQSQFCFSRTVDAALRCLRLFLHNLVRPGHLRVGHDYLVIMLSQTTKWIYQYRDHLDAMSVLTAVGYLEDIIHECGQPQCLPSNEIAKTEREAPGYLVRFVQALFESGLTDTYKRAQSEVTPAQDSAHIPADTSLSPWPSPAQDSQSSSMTTDTAAVPLLDFRHSLDDLTAHLAPQDVAYWHDILGSDMLTFV